MEFPLVRLAALSSEEQQSRSSEKRREVFTTHFVFSLQHVKEPRTLYGGGCSELLVARAVEELASVTPGKEARAMSSCANAFRQLPLSLLRMVATTLPSWSVSSRPSIFLVKAPWV